MIRVSITITFDNGPGTPAFATCPVGGPGPAPSDITDRSRIVVAVSHNFEFITPLMRVFMSSTTVDSTERRTIFKV